MAVTLSSVIRAVAAVGLCCLLQTQCHLAAAEAVNSYVSSSQHQRGLAAEQQGKSNIIPTAGETDAINGNGDLQPGGRCKADIKAFCKDMVAGEARLARCLISRLAADKQGNTAGRSVSEGCQEDLDAFRIQRSQHINKDVELARRCKADVEKFCKTLSDSKSPGSVVACLRDNFSKLAPPCKPEVHRTLNEVAEDYRMDPRLYQNCKASVEKLCPDADGEELDCLVEKSGDIGWECLTEVIRLQKARGGDITLNHRLYKSCYNEQRKFCKGIEPGAARVQACLEDHLDDSGFGGGCKKALEAGMAKKAADVRFDPDLLESCAEDLAAICKVEDLKTIETDKTQLANAKGCLQKHRDALKNSKCAEQVKRFTQRASRDIRFDDVLANACQEDRRQYCNDVQPGSARVIRCLQDHRTNLSQRCAAALFDHEVKMAEDIDFKYPMRKACAWEVSKFCKDVPKGHARVVRCLQENLEAEDMSVECKAEVVRDENRMAQDYRLNFRLKNACEEDIKGLCPGQCSENGMPCNGLVLHCLREKQDNLTSQACAEEVFYYQLMEVTDYRNDIILADACRADVEKYCKDVEPGEGRVHQCLRFHRQYISDRCREEETKLQALEYKDIRLRPKLAKVCSEERAVFCKDVKPGRARVMQCLMKNMAKPNFGSECAAELKKREDALKSDYRYDIGVLTNCRHEIDALCAEAKTKLRGNAQVLKCLVTRFKETGEQCQNEMSRAVRFALWDYGQGAPLTAVCDPDIPAVCPQGVTKRPNGVFTIGAVGRCLSKALVTGQNLSPGCRQLVLVAAPRDARVYLEYPESTSALVKRIAELQRAAGLESVLVDPYTRGGSTVTVTGWVALLCILSIVVVALWGMVLLYRRAAGLDKPHTQYVKSGDA